MKTLISLKRFGVITGILVGFCCQTTLAQGNFVNNGGFELGNTGWTLTDGAFLDITGNPGKNVQLDNVNPSPSVSPTASQTISGLSAGISYVVSGEFQLSKDRGGIAGNPSFGVSINGTSYFQAFQPANFQWQTFSFIYTADLSTAQLSLSSQLNGSGLSYSIDNISMTAAPEPATWVLLGFGFLALSCGRKIGRRIA